VGRVSAADTDAMYIVLKGQCAVYHKPRPVNRVRRARRRQRRRQKRPQLSVVPDSEQLHDAGIVNAFVSPQPSPAGSGVHTLWSGSRVRPSNAAPGSEAASRSTTATSIGFMTAGTMGRPVSTLMRGAISQSTKVSTPKKPFACLITSLFAHPCSLCITGGVPIRT